MGGVHRTDENRLSLFMEKVQIHDSGCWVWQGSKTHGGYGIARWYDKGKVAHRVAYMMLVGDIPDGLDLDHLCRNRACVNPEHLEPVTRSVNLRRGYEARGCVRGHSLVDKSNISLVVRHDGRVEYRCKQCHVLRNVAAKRRKRERNRAAVC